MGFKPLTKQPAHPSTNHYAKTVHSWKEHVLNHKAEDPLHLPMFMQHSEQVLSIINIKQINLCL